MIRWRYTIPLFSSFIWKNIALGFFITFCILFAFFFVLNGFSLSFDFQSQVPDIYFAGGFVGIVIGVTLLVFVLLFWHGFAMEYAVDEKGMYQVHHGASKVHSAAIILGALSRSPSAIGAGLTAKGGEERFISFREAHAIVVDKKRRHIHVSRNFLRIYPIDIFCSKKDFPRILSYIQKHKRVGTALRIID